MKTVNYIMVAVVVMIWMWLRMIRSLKITIGKRKPMPNRELWGYMPN